MLKPTRVAFDRELDDLNADVECLAAQISQSLHVVTDALTTHDPEMAAALVGGHARRVPEIQRCEDRAFAVLARQQPAAGDLRFLVTVGRLMRELERSSKLVDHLASFAATRRRLPSPLVDLLARMAEEARQLFQAATEAYVRRDVAGAEVLDIWDDRLDELHRQFLAELFRAPPDLAATLDVVLAGRYLERVADHAVSFGRCVGYLVTGEL